MTGQYESEPVDSIITILAAGPSLIGRQNKGGMQTIDRNVSSYPLADGGQLNASISLQLKAVIYTERLH